MLDMKLVTYSMSEKEKCVWEELRERVIRNLEHLGLEREAYEVVEEKLSVGDLYSHRFGYSEQDGYYYILARDRGAYSTLFKTEDANEAYEHLLLKLAHDISYKLTLKDSELLRSKYSPLWRYTYVALKREGTHVIQTRVMNSNWKYDACYDYRKYWFELALKILENTVSDSSFRAAIVKYEKLINFNSISIKWKFSTSAMEFITV